MHGRCRLPHLTAELWGDSLAQALDAGPPHISVYDLQVLHQIWRMCPTLAPAPPKGCALQACSQIRGPRQ